MSKDQLSEKNKINLPAFSGKTKDMLPVPATDPVRQYLMEISRYPLLTPEEEEIVTKQYYKTHDPALASRIVTSNLRLVVKIALDFQKFWMQNFLDLVQEGNVGLMHAAKKFDPYKGVKFSYYASFWIKAYIMKFIMDNWRLVKIGTTQAQRKLFYNLNKEKERIKALGYDPTPKRISQALNVREKDVVNMDQRMGAWDLSLNAPVRDDSDDRHMDFLASDETSLESSVARKEIGHQLRLQLEDFARELRDKEKVIFEKRLMAEDPMTLQELGKGFGISRERVRQIEVRLKKKLRKFLESRVHDIDTYNEAVD